MSRETNTESFAELLAGIESGQFDGEVTRELRDLMAKMIDRAEDAGKAKGQITVTVDIEAVRNGRVEICASVKTKAPAPTKKKEVRWLGKQGSLLLQDPRQEALDLRAPGSKVS